jgi:dTDP-4-dehydrorhamnose 3,5-epimerase
MKFVSLPLEGAYMIEPDIYRDERGSFFRFYCADEFREIGHSKPWIQLNHSVTKEKATVRGMHYQLPPHAEIKMVKCIKGNALDVIIDLRKGSPSFMQWTGVELSAENKKMIYIPEGFAHGFQALSDDCELIYHHSTVYKKEAEGGIRWNDPAIGIHWPLPPVHISDRDQQHPLLTTAFSGIHL